MRHFSDTSRLKTIGTDCCAWMNFCPGKGLIATVVMENVVNSWPLRSVKLNGSPVVETSCTAIDTQPLAHMLRQGIQLLERFVQDDRIRIRQPRRSLQVKFTRPVSGKNDFAAYVDAIGQLDGKNCLVECKTCSSRYLEEPHGLVSLDPQLICYSWMTGISDVAQVVFVRKRLVQVQVQYVVALGTCRLRNSSCYTPSEHGTLPVDEKYEFSIWPTAMTRIMQW